MHSATTNTSGGGNWNTGGNWDNGVPGGTDDANVNHAMTINTNIATTRGDYTINSPITDAPGGTAYNLSISGTGGNQGNFDVNANATFEGTMIVSSNGTLTIRSGDTLVVGATTFANGSTVVIETGGVLIINGDLTNNNNSDDITVDGKIIVNGNVTGGNGSAISGGGSVVATGSITTSGSGTIFGGGVSCTPGPCGVGTPPLPITLSYFTARSEGSGVNLFWETLSEINNHFFTLERSTDLTIYEIVRTVAGAGNSREQIAYKASDENPLSGVSYYRLKQTDFDGAFTYSYPVSVNRKSQASVLKVWPNPTDGKLNVHADRNSENGVLHIYTAEGKELMRISLTNEDTVIDLRDLKKGLYLLDYYTPDAERIWTERILRK